MTVDYVFVQNNVCWKLVFGELRKFDVKMMECWICHCMAIWMSFVFFACACSTTNSKPLSTWFYFNNFVDEMFVTKVCILHVSKWKLCFAKWNVFQTTFAWPTFSPRTLG